MKKLTLLICFIVYIASISALKAKTKKIIALPNHTKISNETEKFSKQWKNIEDKLGADLKNDILKMKKEIHERSRKMERKESKKRKTFNYALKGKCRKSKNLKKSDKEFSLFHAKRQREIIDSNKNMIMHDMKSKQEQKDNFHQIEHHLPIVFNSKLSNNYTAGQIINSSICLKK